MIDYMDPKNKTFWLLDVQNGQAIKHGLKSILEAIQEAKRIRLEMA